MRVAAQRLGRRVLLVAVGEAAENEQDGDVEIRYFAHQTNPDDVACYLHAANLLLHPARADTFPSAVVEAMACGLPVVATDVGGIPEQVIDGETGFLVPAGEIVPMAARLFQILSDPMLSRHLGDRAAKVARNKFDFQTTVDRYISWYKEISSRASSNPTSFQE